MTIIKTGLFDRNAVEIEIGDKYCNPTFDKTCIYEIFYKGGCVCGGIDYDAAIPLCWEYSEEDEEELTMDENLNWLELVKKEVENNG